MRPASFSIRATSSSLPFDVSRTLARVERLLSEWFAANARDLPWRHTRDPYAILVSEVMLQQTQVDRVIPRYLAWLERWPTVESLAAATTGDVIREWQGLGYNRRAVNLHRRSGSALPPIGVLIAAELWRWRRASGVRRRGRH